MGVGTRRSRRRAGRWLAAVCFVAALGLTAAPVSAHGTPTCGSLVNRHHPIGEDPAQVQRLKSECGSALTERGGLVIGFGVLSAALAVGVTVSRRRAHRRYQRWRAGRLRAGLPVVLEPALAPVGATKNRPHLIVYEFEPTDIWSARPSLPPAAMAD